MHEFCEVWEACEATYKDYFLTEYFWV